MITGLDHVVVAVKDLDPAAEGFRKLLGRAPAIYSGGGASRAWFQLPNMALELIAPTGPGPAAERVGEWLESGEGVAALAFHCFDLEGSAKLLARRGVPTGEPSAAELADTHGGMHMMRSVTCDPAATAGIRMMLIGRGDPIHEAEPLSETFVDRLDHVVVVTPNPDRALALYGARLGLDLRLDRSNPAWGMRQLFFRCGEAVLEVGARLGEPVSDAPDRLGGLAWRISEPEAVQARIAAAGFDVSEVRQGRKPGSKVFTVRDAPAGIPTLMLSQDPAREEEPA
jgi:catechol 2,3-dioxygenase-like lactoylglutathione lyase family enzyme